MKKGIFLLMVSAMFAFILHSGCGNKTTNDQTRPDSIVYKHTAEGDLMLFFHYPDDWTKNDQRPLIVFFFGGGWAGGTTEQFRFQAEYLASRGMVAVRADYRVLNRHGTPPDKCVEDGKSAVRWLRKNAALLGADPDRIVSAGGSAGGHVAICTQVVEGFEAEGEDLSVSSQPNLLVLFNPVMQTSVERIAERFGSSEMASKLSPNDHLDESVPPMIMFFGTEDRLKELAITTLSMAPDLNLDVQLWMAPGQVHAFFNQAPWQESTLYLTDKFLIENGYLRGNTTVALPEDGKMELYQLP